MVLSQERGLYCYTLYVLKVDGVVKNISGRSKYVSKVNPYRSP